MLNMLEIGVGMGLMSSIFACNVRLKQRKSDIVHFRLIVFIVLILLIGVIVVLFYYRLVTCDGSGGTE